MQQAATHNFPLWEKYVLVTDTWELKQLQELMVPCKVIALDTEATDKYPWTAIPLLLQVAMTTHQGLRPFIVVLPRFSHEELAPFLRELARKTHLVLAHNANYEYKLLKHHYGIELANLYDTMIAEQMLTSGDYDNKTEWMRHLGLKYLCYEYLGQEMDKEERKTFLDVVPGEDWLPTDEQAEYAARDAMVLPAIAQKQWERLEAEDMLAAARLRMDAIGPVADMELRGLLVDQKAWREFLAEQQQKATETEIELRVMLDPYERKYRLEEHLKHEQERAVWLKARTDHEALLKYRYDEWGEQEPETQPTWKDYKTEGMRAWRAAHPNPGPSRYDPTEVINLNSHVQVQRAFSALGLDAESTDAKSREKLLRKPDLTDEQRRVLTVYSQHTKLTKLLSSFGESLLARIRTDTGRLHAEYTIHLTETGRMASQNPNMQNIPREASLRHAFIADPGCMTITADFKSQELAVSAALSGDAQMRADIMAGRDLYKELATSVFNTTLEAVTKEQRQQCKNALLGITYGLSANGMVSRYFIDKALAESLLKGVRDRYPTFVKWSDSQVDKARTQMFVSTAAGAKRYFRDPDALGWKLSTEPRNAPVQGTAAEIMYRSIARLKRVLPSYAYLANVVHDEAVTNCKTQFAQDIAQLVEREMMQAFVDILPFEQYGVRCGVDVTVAPYWTKD